jgi:hypothetical protein
MDLALLGVSDGVEHDVCDVLVGELVGDFASAAHAFDEVGPAKNAQVLADQRLRQVEALNELVDALLAVGERAHQGDPDGRGESAKEFRGLVEAVDGAAVIHMHRLPCVHD